MSVCVESMMDECEGCVHANMNVCEQRHNFTNG